MRTCEACGPEVEVPVDEPTCPSCGRELEPPLKAPWHFKLLVVSLVIYLGWRAWQGVAWVLGRL